MSLGEEEGLDAGGGGVLARRGAHTTHRDAISLGQCLRLSHDNRHMCPGHRMVRIPKPTIHRCVS
jgi:hypothetical protein